MDDLKRFPKHMPVGMAYVPMQVPERIYDEEEALRRGTIYPDLDLPFKGQENCRPLPNTLMTEVMQADFVCHDLGLYLDTHPDDEDAKMYYNHMLAQSRKAHEKYVKNFGPLSKRDGYIGHENCWLTSPWPWEYISEGGVY